MTDVYDVARACQHCGMVYYEPADTPGPGYMYECHFLFECTNPDKMERAWLNASPLEKEEVWP